MERHACSFMKGHMINHLRYPIFTRFTWNICWAFATCLLMNIRLRCAGNYLCGCEFILVYFYHTFVYGRILNHLPACGCLGFFDPLLAGNYVCAFRMPLSCATQMHAIIDFDRNLRFTWNICWAFATCLLMNLRLICWWFSCDNLRFN